MRYLLDTNILSDLMKYPGGRVMRQIEHVGHEEICTSIIVVAEIEFGIERKKSARLRAQFNGILQSLVVEPFAEPAEKHYAAIRTETEINGLTVGQNDLLIAAHTMALDAVLVSDDRIFLGIPNLKIENWLGA